MFDMPPLQRGTETEQIEGIYRYLVQLQEQLDVALHSISLDNFTHGEQDAVREFVNSSDGTTKSDLPTALQKEASLKSLILKTADTIKSTEQEIRKRLSRDYVAESQFGTYFSKASNEQVITPDGTTQSFTLSEGIKNARDALGDYDEAERTYKGYIKSGRLDDGTGDPVYGVGIGKELVQYLQDGQVVYQRSNRLAELTDEGLRFYQNGSMIAQFSASGTKFYENGSVIATYNADGITFAGDLKINSGKSISLNDAISISEGGINMNTAGAVSLISGTSNGTIRFGTAFTVGSGGVLYSEQITSKKFFLNGTELIPVYVIGDSNQISSYPKNSLIAVTTKLLQRSFVKNVTNNDNLPNGQTYSISYTKADAIAGDTFNVTISGIQVQAKREKTSGAGNGFNTSNGQTKLYIEAYIGTASGNVLVASTSATITRNDSGTYFKLTLPQATKQEVAMRMNTSAGGTLNVVVKAYARQNDVLYGATDWTQMVTGSFTVKLVSTTSGSGAQPVTLYYKP